MGIAASWFRAILGLKKRTPPLPPSPRQQRRSPSSKEKRRWRFVKSYREKSHHRQQSQRLVLSREGDDEDVPAQVYTEVDQSKRAVAVAAATAAVAEAAVAAAQAAAQVVRLTSSGMCEKNNVKLPKSANSHQKEDMAALRIQAAFRGFLARRALRALRALVRLQALVRGHIDRKRTTEWLHRMRALLQTQARAHAGRTKFFESSHSASKASHLQHPGPPTPEKSEHAVKSKSRKHELSLLKRGGGGSKCVTQMAGDQDKGYLSSNWSWLETWDQCIPLARNGMLDNDNGDKILEGEHVGNSRFSSRSRSLFHSSRHHAWASEQYAHSFAASKGSITHQNSPSSCESQSSSPFQQSHKVEDTLFTTDNSPQFYSASSRGGGGRRSPFTPSKDSCSVGFLSGYIGYPNYMSCTESSRAKIRSFSAPKQRPKFERSNSTKRHSIHGSGDQRSTSGHGAHALQATFIDKAYPGSGQLDLDVLRMPVQHGLKMTL